MGEGGVKGEGGVTGGKKGFFLTHRRLSSAHLQSTPHTGATGRELCTKNNASRWLRSEGYRTYPTTCGTCDDRPRVTTPRHARAGAVVLDCRTLMTLSYALRNSWTWRSRRSTTRSPSVAVPCLPWEMTQPRRARGKIDTRWAVVLVVLVVWLVLWLVVAVPCPPALPACQCAYMHSIATCRSYSPLSVPFPHCNLQV